MGLPATERRLHIFANPKTETHQLRVKLARCEMHHPTIFPRSRTTSTIDDVVLETAAALGLVIQQVARTRRGRDLAVPNDFIGHTAAIR